jgi:hypothetical protein
MGKDRRGDEHDQTICVGTVLRRRVMLTLRHGPMPLIPARLRSVIVNPEAAQRPVC